MAHPKCLHCSNHPRNGKVCSDCLKHIEQAEKFKPTVAAFIESIQAPPGFVKTTGVGTHTGIEFYGPDTHWSKDQPWWQRTLFVLLENAADGIKIALNVSQTPEMHREVKRGPRGAHLGWKRAVPTVSASGHTCYKTEKGFWVSFDARGVSDSFYVSAYSPMTPTTITEQVERVTKSRERSKGMLQIPGFGYSVHKDDFEAMKKRLQDGGSQTFTPRGFGTGHRVSTRPSRYATQLSAETAQFFGVPALYDETFDHD
jgi:hypothetical protein